MLSGTIFIDRTSSASTASVAEQMSALLAQNVAVLLFPEGTSSNGSAVGRFHPSLFDPATGGSVPVTAAAIRYSVTSLAEKDLCYYGDVRLVPHIMQTLGQHDITGTITFAPTPHIYPDRRTAAAETWSQVTSMHQSALPREEHHLPCAHASIC
jgi:1-acyl-sn-glycerol-3-phosphate acyltransferase